MKEKPLKFGIHRKILAAICLTAIIPSMAGIFFLYSQHYKMLTSSQINGLQDVIIPVAHVIRLHVLQKVQRFHQIAADPVLISNMNQSVQGAQIKMYLHHLKKYEPHVESIMVTDITGNVLFSTRPDAPAEVREERWWKTIIRNDSLPSFIISDIKNRSRKGPRTFDITVPIRKNPKSVVLGMFKASINADYLTQIITSFPFDFPILIMNTSGQMLPEISELPGLSAGMPEKTHQMLLGNRMFAPVLAGDFFICSMPVFFSSDPKQAVAGSNPFSWRLAIMQPAKPIFAARKRAMARTMAVTAFMFAMLMLFAYLMFRHIGRPLSILQSNIDALAEGRLDVRISDINSNDEIGRLADSFNIMVRKLDLTQRAMEKQNAELVRLNQVKSNFVNMVSHELRTPLMIIKESVSLLLSGVKGGLNREQTQVMSICNRNAIRLHQIINDLLDISRIEAGKVELNRAFVNLVPVCKDVIHAFEPQTEVKRVSIRFSSMDDHIPVYADAAKVDHILTNLLSNALKFCYEDGTISVDIEKFERFIKISVSDTGIGIAQQNLGKIFDKFEKLNNQPLSGKASTGLGLSIAQEFVRLHKGELSVESTEYVGSRFSFTLPVFNDSEYLIEHLNDTLTRNSEDGGNFSLLCLKIINAPESLHHFRAETVEAALERIKGALAPATKKAEVLFQQSNQRMLIVTDMKKARSLLLENDIWKIIYERFPTIVPENRDIILKAACAAFPEDAKSVLTMLTLLDNRLSARANADSQPKSLATQMLDHNYITEKQLLEALKLQKENQRFLGEILIETGMVSPERVGRAMEEELGLAYIHLEDYRFDKKMLKLLDQQYIIENKVIPIIKGDSAAVVALVHPFGQDLIGRIEQLINLQVIPVVTTKKEFYEFILENF